MMKGFILFPFPFPLLKSRPCRTQPCVTGAGPLSSRFGGNVKLLNCAFTSDFRRFSPHRTGHWMYWSRYIRKDVRVAEFISQQNIIKKSFRCTVVTPVLNFCIQPGTCRFVESTKKRKPTRKSIGKLNSCRGPTTQLCTETDLPKWSKPFLQVRILQISERTAI